MEKSKERQKTMSMPFTMQLITRCRKLGNTSKEECVVGGIQSSMKFPRQSNSTRKIHIENHKTKTLQSWHELHAIVGGMPSEQPNKAIPCLNYRRHVLRIYGRYFKSQDQLIPKRSPHWKARNPLRRSATYYVRPSSHHRQLEQTSQI